MITAATPATGINTNNAPADLFASSNPARGEWYFYNSSLKITWL